MNITSEPISAKKGLTAFTYHYDVSIIIFWCIATHMDVNTYFSSISFNLKCLIICGTEYMIILNFMQAVPDLSLTLIP